MSQPGKQWTEAEREQVFAEAMHFPESGAERTAQQAKFRAWLADDRYQHLWPMLERLVQADPDVEESGALPMPSRAAR